MENSPRLKMPYLMPQQAQKHVTHNEAIRMLDALVQTSVTSDEISTPPNAPEEGDAYIIPENAIGEWTTQSTKLTAFQDGAWAFFEPAIGMIAWVEDKAAIAVFDGESWMPVSGNTEPSQLGINASADTQNRFAISSPSSLFNHEGSSHQLKVNRNHETDTASTVYQTGFEGNAETGLVETEAYQVKVSQDGQNWSVALDADIASGEVTFPHTPLLSHHALNLFADSGRLCSPTTAITAGPFAKPAYLQEHNGATLSGLAKFINNNSDHGGSGETLDPEIHELITKIRAPAYRRNGVEFHVAKLTKGAGTNYPINHAGAPYYLTLALRQALRLPTATAHFYLKPIKGPVLLRLLQGQSVRIDAGDEQTENVWLAQGEPWRSIMITDQTNPYENWSYSPSHINLLQESEADEALIACLSIVGGKTTIDPNTGIMPTFGSWPA